MGPLGEVHCGTHTGLSSREEIFMGPSVARKLSKMGCQFGFQQFSHIMLRDKQEHPCQSWQKHISGPSQKIQVFTPPWKISSFVDIFLAPLEFPRLLFFRLKTFVIDFRYLTRCTIDKWWRLKKPRRPSNNKLWMRSKILTLCHHLLLLRPCNFRVPQKIKLKLIMTRIAKTNLELCQPLLIMPRGLYLSQDAALLCNQNSRGKFFLLLGSVKGWTFHRSASQVNF